MLRARRHRQILSVVLAILGGAALVTTLAYLWAGARAQRAETAQLERQLDLHAQALQQRIDRYRTLPQVLAQDPDLRAALVAPVDDARRNALNQRLEDANSVTRSSTLTLIDRHGIALAASAVPWRSISVSVDERVTLLASSSRWFSALRRASSTGATSAARRSGSCASTCGSVR